MKIGIIANTSKPNVVEVVFKLIKKLKQNKLGFLLSDKLLEQKAVVGKKIKKNNFVPDKILYEESDIIISLGGDGTMLSTAYHAVLYDKPVLGINIGKFGFLIEANVKNIDVLIDNLKQNNFTIEERMVIKGECVGHKLGAFYAINDITIDKGGWPKMIDLKIHVDDEFVTTVSSDGLIIATPTGSTGYSISVGGPIVSPKADVITLSPISPHTLTFRPIVLPSYQKIQVLANSQHKNILVNCDGQRVYSFPPSINLIVRKSEKSLKMVHTSLSSYFETLRNKLLWGVDLRKNSFNRE